MRALSLPALPFEDRDRPALSMPPPAVLGLIGLAAMASLFSVNVGLALASFVALTLLFFLLWRPGEPPVLLFVLGYQWL
ncbi:MAG: hypothetical protein R3362_12170, partial [Rhodothermales bacterium]|nr:hypothetical protein [Rhodothermales bacterium]